MSVFLALHNVLRRLVLTRQPKACTGNFFIDDEVLVSEGITDLSKLVFSFGFHGSSSCRALLNCLGCRYNVDSAVSQHELQPDFFC